jgi:hypothetical protein
LVVTAALVSLYLVYLASQFYGARGPSPYEPKDFERQRLMEETGRSVIDPTKEPARR